jgi:hypothetical protein
MLYPVEWDASQAKSSRPRIEVFFIEWSGSETHDWVGGEQGPTPRNAGRFLMRWSRGVGREGGGKEWTIAAETDRVIGRLA